MNEPIRFYKLYEYSDKQLINYLTEVEGYCEYDLRNFSNAEEIADHIIAQGFTHKALEYLSNLRQEN